MARTVVATGDAITIKKYSASLSLDVWNKSFWLKKLSGKATEENIPAKPVIIYTDLEKDAGDSISYDLLAKLSGQGVEGDNTLEGNEEKLIIFTDSQLIDQLRHGVDAGGKMSRKRTKHDLPMRGKAALGEWYAQFLDEAHFVYAGGDRGDATTNWLLPVPWTGRAGNTLHTPEATHNIWGGDATSDATIDTSDVMTLSLVDRAVQTARNISPMMKPCDMGGDQVFVLVMHDYQWRSMKTNTATGQWLDIQKAAGVRGQANPIFQGDDYCGRYNGVDMFKHPMVPYFTDWGGTTYTGARALFLGTQALCLAWGSPDGANRWSFWQELDDRGNVEICDVGAIWGVNKPQFNSKDWGVIAIDTYASAT
jgi:N4-gp56 family major capsid protein